jgi:membrane associated rhomboid family serine protease
MGIYDRDYYRREGPSYIGSFMQTGKVCKWLIIINVACFFLQNLLTETQQVIMETPTGQAIQVPHSKQPFTEFMQLDAEAVCNGQIWRLLTHAFMHAGIMHLFWNMLLLWWFGTDVEDLYGPKEFLIFYLTAAVVAGLVFVAAWAAGWGNAQYGVGASGAVMAVIVVCAFHYPTRIIWVFGIFPMPIWFFVLFSVGKDFLTFATLAETTTAVSAHLGGAVFGFAYYELHWRLSNFIPNLKSVGRRPRARLRVYREEVEPRPAKVSAPMSPDVDEQLEAKLDLILEKVARSGQASLSETERQILLRASEVYKKKKT